MRILSLKKIAAKLRPERGNVFTLMLGAVALLGTLGYATQVMITGPVSTMSKAHNETMARYSMRLAAQLIIANTALNSSTIDCDSDSRVEPMAYKTGTGPTGGGQIPDNVTTQNTDPWGNVYGYCVWDMGNTFDAAGCGGPSAKRLNGNDDPVSGNVETQTVFAIVSSGRNRQFETTCSNYSNGTTAVVTKGGDDLVLEYTYMEAGAASFGSSGGGVTDDGIWSLQSPTVAETAKNLEIGSDVAINVSAGSATFDKVNITSKLTATGGLQLAASGSSTCTSMGSIRYNTTSKTVEYCGTFAAPVWTSTQVEQNFISPWTSADNYKEILGTNREIIVSQNASAQALTAAGAGVKMIWYPDKVAFRSGLAYSNYWDDALIGIGSVSTGARTFAFGAGSVVMGGDSAGGTDPAGVVGPYSWSQNGVAIGINAGIGQLFVAAPSSFAEGKNSVALGTASVVMGENANVSAQAAAGRGSMAIGTNVTVSGNSSRSTAIGNNVTISNANNAFAIGLKSSGPADTVSTANSFIITGGGLIVNNTSRAQSGSALEVHSWTTKKTVATGTAWGTICSDARVKNVVGLFKGGLDQILKLNMFRFRYREGNIYKMDPKEDHTGFIAQNVQKSLPEATPTAVNGYMGIDTNVISYAIINSIKELKAHNDTLEKRAASLRKDVARMERILHPPSPARLARKYALWLACFASISLFCAALFLRRKSQ